MGGLGMRGQLGPRTAIVRATACAATALALLPTAAGAKQHLPKAGTRLPAPPAGAKPHSACSGANTPAMRLSFQTAQTAIVCLINESRRQHGLRRLRVVPALQTAATSYALEMVTD